MRISQILLLFFLLCICQYIQAQSYSKETQQRIKAVEKSLTGWVQEEGQLKGILSQRMKDLNIKGVSVAVIKDYKIDWVKSYGWADEAEQRPVTPQTRFQAGSISKSLNAVGLLTLVQDKKVDLYTDINQYLTTWKFPYDSVAKGKTISLANLLSHTAGLSVHGFPGYAVTDSIPTVPQVLDGKRPANTEAVRSLFEPGLKFQYAGGGTTISQLLLMDVTHEPYDKYMWTHVLQPLGMTGSTYTQPLHPDNPSLYATAYYEDGREVKGKYHIYPEQAAAGLWTTPTDLSKYTIETQLALQGKSSIVLSQELTRLRLTPYIDSEAALGVFIVEKGGVKYFSHNGQDEGFTASYMGTMDGGNGVVVMSNSNSSTLNQELINSIANVYGWKGFEPVVKKVVQLPDSLLSKYVGTFKIEQDTLLISQKDKALILGVKGTAIQWKLHFTSPTEFYIEELQGELSSTKGSDGNVDAMVLKQGTHNTKIERLQ